ncbi:TMEM165/GDT1 family protein [Myxococcota bacterium]|nr:TMEM165/GDT1 family protein [Myxococcota bacterium]
MSSPLLDLAQTFALILLAELGDKSMLACVALGARLRAGPVILGALLAFSGLNALGVLFGASVGAALPPVVVAAIVAGMFLAFGAVTLLGSDDEDDDEAPDAAQTTGRSALLTTMSLLFFAELGDKTQLAVAALSSDHHPVAVWAGATAGLTLTSALGVWAGQALLTRLPKRGLRLAAGALFLAFGAAAAWRAWSLFAG